MMILRVKPGFTLMEAMLAIAIVGLIMAPLFTLQDTILNAVSRVALQFDQLVRAKQFLYTVRQEQKPTVTQFSLERQEKNPTTYLSYTLSSVTKMPVLKNVKNLYKEEVTARGIDKMMPTTSVFTLCFKPSKVKES